MPPMAISFIFAIVTLGAGLYFRKAWAKRIGRFSDSGKGSAEVATLTVAAALGILILGSTASIFLDPEDEFNHSTGVTLGIAALIVYAGSRTTGFLHNRMAKTLRTSSNIYARVDESLEDYSQALRTMSKAYLIAATLGGISGILSLIY